MITMKSVSAAQASSYYEKDDYYTEGGQMPAVWGGELAATLGLVGEFDHKKFASALRGDFDGHVFKQRPSPKRAALDCCFSAPKSVSIMALVVGDKRIIEAHDRAVKAAMARLATLARVRITENGQTTSVSVAGGIAYAAFRHDTSRLGDCNIHSHCPTLKAVMGPDGKLLSLDNKEMFRAQHEANSVYMAALAQELRSMGYRLVLTKHGFEIEGVSASLIDEMSQRRKQIIEYMVRHGIDPKTANAASRSIANLGSRPNKKHYDRHALLVWWKDRLSFLAKTLGIEPTALTPEVPTKAKELEHHGHTDHHQGKTHYRGITGEVPPFRRDRMHHLSELDVVRDIRRTQMLLPRDVYAHVDDDRADRDKGMQRDGDRQGNEGLSDAALGQALEHITEKKSVIANRHDLIAQAIQFSEYRVTAEQIDEAIEARIANGDLLVGERGRMTTRAALETEEAIYAAYDRGLDVCKPLADKTFAGMKLTEAERQLGGEMTPGQRRMVENIATSTDRVMVVEGDAGTGKSTAMAAVKSIAEAKGYKVLGLAPSDQALRSLQDSGIDTITSQRSLVDEKFWNSVDRHTIIVMDEAGLVDARSMRSIIDRVEASGARIVTVGDDKQFASVESGRALYQLNERANEHGRGSRLDEMRRGKTDEMRALHFAARDNPLEALDKLFEAGRVSAYQDDARRIEALARDYAGMSEERRGKALVLTGTNADRIKINEAIREALSLKDGIEIKSFERRDYSKAELRQIASYEVGDVVRFEAGAGEFKKGDMLRVMEKTGDKLIVQRGDGEQIEFYPHRQAKNVSIGNEETIEIAPGERIRFTASDKAKGIANGDRGTVLTAGDGRLKIRLDGGKDIEIEGKMPLAIRHGYCQTGHSAQGATAGDVLLHVKGADATADRKSWYTNITRAAKDVRLYTDALEAKRLAALREAIGRENNKELAHEVIGGQKSEGRAHAPLTYIGPAKGWERETVEPHGEDQAIAEALERAQARFGERLHIQGSREFKDRVAAAVVAKGMDVKFTDKALDEKVQTLKARLEPREQTRPETTQELPASSAGSSSKLRDFIDQAKAKEEQRKQEEEERKQQQRGPEYGDDYEL